MSEQAPEQAPADVCALLAALRSAGALRVDPVRWHRLEALARRAPLQPPAVRQLLERRLAAELAAFAGRLADAPAAAGARTVALRSAANDACAPLVQLNRYIRAATAPPSDGSGDAAEPDELASARRFRQSWMHGRTQDRLAEASARRPANAGPLNSHVLVLQALALMRELSPDYLRHFLVHVESLQWLEQARAKDPTVRQAAARKQAKASPRARTKK